MYQHILVPLDGSKLAETILPHAEELARRFQADVLLVRAADVAAMVMAEVQPMDGGMPADLIDETIEEEEQEARDYLAQTAQRLKDAGVSVAWEVVEGQPARAIIEAAGRHNSDLICLATHGRSGLQRAILGSVADQVVRESHHPVLLVRPAVPPSEE